jgi:hypothetical protein
MNRRTWLGSLVSALAAIGCGPLVRFAFAQSGQAADLSETLRFGLKCRRPLEFEFVALVVEKVEQQQLPRELVLSMFDYAKKQRPNQPFPYFEAGMRKRAAAIGVAL